MRLSPAAIGRAGELRVASELLLRGYRPRTALIDDGVDLELETGRTIQIKTGLAKNPSGAYCFSFQTSRSVSGRRLPIQHMVADIAICWCVTDDLFYVIPSDAIGRRTVIFIPTRSRNRTMFDQYRGAWELLDVDLDAQEQFDLDTPGGAVIGLGY